MRSADRPPTRVVDLGCGTGTAGAAVALEARARVDGVDLNRWAVAEANWAKRGGGVRLTGRLLMISLVMAAAPTGALGEYIASPVAGDRKVYVANQEGKITVLKAGAQWEVLAGGRIYVRTRGAVYCFRSSPRI